MKRPCTVSHAIKAAALIMGDQGLCPLVKLQDWCQRQGVWQLYVCKTPSVKALRIWHKIGLCDFAQTGQHNISRILSLPWVALLELILHSFAQKIR